MSRCVEKPFAPLLAVWSYQGVSPHAPPRGYGTACAVTRQSGRGHWATAVGRWHTA